MINNWSNTEAKKYISNGFEVMIENNLGSHLGISDDDFTKEGCKIDSRENVLNQSNIILQLNLPDEKSTNLLRENKILIGNFNSSSNNAFNKGSLLVHSSLNILSHQQHGIK